MQANIYLVDVVLYTWNEFVIEINISTGIRGGMRGSVGRPVPYNPQPQRELISVPVTDQGPDYKRPRLQQSEPNTNVEVSV